MTILKWTLILLGLLLLLVGGYTLYTRTVVNERVVADITNNPEGDRAGIVMLLNLPTGKQIPVNYLRENGKVYAGADGSWWREIAPTGSPVQMMIRGESVAGVARVILDDQATVDDVFSRLRPTVPEWLPDWANGKLIEVRLDSQ
jgi:hypothetical protein